MTQAAIHPKTAHPRQVVLVEDDSGLRQALERLLRTAGYEVRSFGSAEELLQSQAQSQAACLILDVRLPGLSGFQLGQRLLEEGLHPPVIYLTAYDDALTRRQADRNGAVAFLPKPFDGNRLIEIVGLALALH